jgi:plastocyanin
MLSHRIATLALTASLAVGLAVAGSLSGTVGGGKGSAVVYINAIPGKTFDPPAKHVAMDQKGLKFVPHVIVVQAGITVDFLNGDKVQHNIFWPSINGNKKLSHNMGTWPTGEIRSFKFTQPGVVPLLCNVHPEMSGYIIVSPTPYFAEAAADGSYKIDNLPDGQYTVSAWKEGKKVVSKPVTVSGNAKLDFSF